MVGSCRLDGRAPGADRAAARTAQSSAVKVGDEARLMSDRGGPWGRVGGVVGGSVGLGWLVVGWLFTRLVD